MKKLLKLNIQKTNIMESGPIISCQIDGEKMETVTDYFLELQNQELKTVTTVMKLKNACSSEGKQ